MGSHCQQLSLLRNLIREIMKQFQSNIMWNLVAKSCLYFPAKYNKKQILSEMQ